MKKLLAILLAAVMLLVFASCGDKTTYTIAYSADVVKGAIATTGASSGTLDWVLGCS